MKRAYFNWSSGKDSALALYRALNGGEFSIEVLFSVLKSEGQRIAMHETGIELLKKQADAIGIELMPFYFNSDWSGETYEAAMSESDCPAQGKEYHNGFVRRPAFGNVTQKKGTEMQRRGDNCCVSIMGDISTGCPC